MAITTHDDGTAISIQPFTFAATSDDPLHNGQMHAAPDWDKFALDMQQEVADHLASNSVQIDHRDSMP
jgi:hypothetical protein